jgi:TonB-dependent starch-binding outer membrane protein SusC
MRKFTFIFYFWKRAAFLILFIFGLMSLTATAQENITVTGTISSAGDGSVIPGATVKVKNTTNGVAADANGKYSISAPRGSTLVFSALSYENVEAAVKGNSLNISLPSKQNGLNEVLVIGYGTTTRQDITTAVTKVDPKTIPQDANNSVEELLFGRAAGLNVQQASTQPGGAINLSIRGQGAPLIVVDGAIYANNGLEPTGGAVDAGTNGVNRGAMEGINPNDIESIEILKDASASIYGVNAANGVILITTKKGKNGKMNINFGGSHSFVNNTSYLQPLDASQYETLYDVFQKDQYLGTHSMVPYGTTADSGLPTPKYSADQIAAAGAGTNWLNQIFRKGYIDNDNLSISGGTDKTTYYFSGGYFNQLGTLDGSALTKYTGRANLSFNLAKWVTLNTNFTGSSNIYQNSSSGGQFDGSGQQGFGIIQAALGYPANVPVYTNGALSTYGIISNPVGLEQVQDHTYYHNLEANLSADFKLIPDALTGRILFVDNYESATRDFFVPSSIFFYQQYLSRASLNYNDRDNETLEASLNYKKTFAKIFKVDLVGGAGQYISSYNAFSAGGTGAQDGLTYTDLAAETGNIAITSNKVVNTTRSYFGRGTFSILDRYLLSASIRDDGYSLFFPNKKYAIFPAGSIGWKINEEPFFKNVAQTVDLLKVRASIGVTGQTIGSAAYGGYSPNGDNIFLAGGQEYVTISQYALDNPNLTWQKTINRNVGLDFGLFRDRISGSIDVFHNDITNLLNTTAPTPPLAPIFTETENGAHEVRTGYEVALISHNVTAKDFDWSTTINASHYFFRYQTQFPFTVLQPYQSVTDAVDEIYYFKTAGLLQPGQTVPASQPTTGGANLPGSPIFVDRNGDGKLDYHDVYKMDPDPKISLGFGNTFRYRQFDLTVFFYGQLGGHGTNLNYAWGDPVSIVSAAQGGTVQAQQVFSSSNLSGTRPSVNYVESAVGLLVPSDLNITSTDFVRLRNLTFGYTLNSGSINQFAKSIRLFVDAQNLFIITNYKGGDPEVNYAAVKGGYAPYPPARTLSFGVKASF